MMNYYQLATPQKWQAGISAPGTPNEQTFYFDCADCGAKEPEIAGFLGTGPTFRETALIAVDGGPFVNPALFCAPCFDKRLVENDANQKRLDEIKTGIRSEVEAIQQLIA